MNKRSTPHKSVRLGVEFDKGVVLSQVTPALAERMTSVLGAQIEKVRSWLIATNPQLLDFPFEARAADNKWEVVLAHMRLRTCLDGRLAQDIPKFLQTSNCDSKKADRAFERERKLELNKRLARFDLAHRHPT